MNTNERPARALEIFGWTPSPLPWCPQRLIRHGRCRRGYGGPNRCPCDVDLELYIDHVQMWDKRGGGRIISTEPYMSDAPEDIAKALRSLTELFAGFRVRHHPGVNLWNEGTELFTIEHRDQD